MHEKQCAFPPLSDGCLSNGRFLWKKWDFCSEVKKNNKCRNKMQKAVYI